jgi:hypothetical protein
MALKILQPGIQPIGQFDGLDSEVTAVKGGEVVGFTFVNIGQSVDKSASDINDGYVSYTTKKRPAVTKTLVSGMRPLFLVDDGTTGYGTLFGQLVGSYIGQQSVGGTVLGPHTAAGSGKLTLWDKPGLYAVTLDACDTTASTGLQPSNTTLAGGAALYATAAGLLTPNVSAAFESVVVGRFIQFQTNGSLVTTPNSLVAATNVPAGNVASTIGSPFVQAEFWFTPPAS